MEINNHYAKLLESVKQNKSKQPLERNETDSKEVKESPVEVNISKEAQDLLKADKAEVSMRVEEIKEQIQNGEYQVDPDKISAGLLKSIQDQQKEL